jgi:hypothetical protein
MAAIYYNGDISQFIEAGGVDSVIAFFDDVDITQTSNEALETLTNTRYALIVKTSDRKFGALEAEDIYMRNMYHHHAPHIEISWENKNGVVEYIKPRFKEMKGLRYLMHDKNIEIAISENGAPVECLKLLEKRTDIKQQSLWYYILSGETVLYFIKDQIREYDENKDYCVVMGIEHSDSVRKISISQVDDVGDYLVIKCHGPDNWYTLCERISIENNDL